MVRRDKGKRKFNDGPAMVHPKPAPLIQAIQEAEATGRTMTDTEVREGQEIPSESVGSG